VVDAAGVDLVLHRGELLSDGVLARY
jgi:hypothetical protein